MAQAPSGPDAHIAAPNPKAAAAAPHFALPPMDRPLCCPAVAPCAQFMQGCRAFHPVGFNLESLAQAAYEPVDATGEGEPGGRRRLASHDAIPDNRHKVDELLRTAAQAGLNVMRTWAHTTDPKHPLQASQQSGPGPGPGPGAGQARARAGGAWARPSPRGAARSLAAAHLRHQQPA